MTGNEISYDVKELLSEMRQETRSGFDRLSAKLEEIDRRHRDEAAAVRERVGVLEGRVDFWDRSGAEKLEIFARIQNDVEHLKAQGGSREAVLSFLKWGLTAAIAVLSAVIAVVNLAVQ